jgi:hypothetical protein
LDVRIDNRSLICESIKNRKIDFFNTALDGRVEEGMDGGSGGSEDG